MFSPVECTSTNPARTYPDLRKVFIVGTVIYCIILKGINGIYQMAKLLSSANIQETAVTIGIVIVFCWLASRHIHDVAKLMGLKCYDETGAVVVCE